MPSILVDDDAPSDATLARVQRIRRRDADAAAKAADRRSLARDLRAALNTDPAKAGALQVYYQPRLALSSGACVSAEALLRWPHCRRGMVSPGVFIPVAEQCGLISQIGGHVLKVASTAAASWPGNTSVSVNMSARQLQDGSLLGQVSAALELSGLAAERLELELTESMVLDCDVDTLLVLSALRDLGVELALDDFGTGYASLSMLKKLPLTVIKLDRSLIRELPHNSQDAAIARASVQTGHALGLAVVAEGIETEQQRIFLEGLGCDQGQGFLFSPAIPAPRLMATFLAGAEYDQAATAPPGPVCPVPLEHVASPGQVRAAPRGPVRAAPLGPARAAPLGHVSSAPLGPHLNAA